MLIELVFIIIGGGIVWLFGVIFKVDSDIKFLSSFGFLFATVSIALFVHFVFPGIIEKCRYFLKLSKARILDFLIAYGLILIVFSAIVFLGKIFGLIVQFPETTKLLTVKNIIAAFFSTVIVGFCEEFIYRGVITVYFLKNTNKIFTIISVSILFAFGHLNYSGLLPYLTAVTMGVVTTLFVLETRSLYISIGLHCGWNFIYFIFDIVYNLEEIVFPFWGNIFELYQIGILLIFTIIFYFSRMNFNRQNIWQTIGNEN